MVGGPNVCPPNAPALEQAFAATMGNKLAFGPSAARYAPLGVVRESSEKELILCNLAARKGALLELGGFDEALYPNEENALMDDLQKRGGRLIYDPEFIVQRRPRSTVKAFAKMLMTYGRGRAEQFRLHPTMGSALNFAPPLFVVYLLALPLLPGWLALPLIAYTVIVLAGAKFRLFTVAPLIVATHIFYGLGFWRGLFTSLKRGAPSRDAQVTLERISPE
jgi:succinoglycan biosynthesis protein ExoA